MQISQNLHFQVILQVDLRWPMTLICIFMGLGHNDPLGESHMWPQQTWGQRSSRGQWPLDQGFDKKVTLSTYLRCIFMGLGHSDPWVVSHMWPQQTWGQRSCWGQWPLVQVLVWGQIWYYNGCKSMWSRKQARLMVQELPCFTRFDDESYSI